jgi:hypothetical protein
MTRIKDRFKDMVECHIEKYEENNRIDLNVKSQENSECEIQIEFKKATNKSFKKGIKAQLIAKYLEGKVSHGIYFVLNDKKTTKDELLITPKKIIPPEYNR